MSIDQNFPQPVIMAVQGDFSISSSRGRRQDFTAMTALNGTLPMQLSSASRNWTGGRVIFSTLRHVVFTEPFRLQMPAPQSRQSEDSTSEVSTFQRGSGVALTLKHLVCSLRCAKFLDFFSWLLFLAPHLHGVDAVDDSVRIEDDSNEADLTKDRRKAF